MQLLCSEQWAKRKDLGLIPDLSDIVCDLNLQKFMESKKY